MSLEVFLPPLCAYTAPLRGLAAAGGSDLLLGRAPPPPPRAAPPASPASSSPSRRHLHLLHHHHHALLGHARAGAERVKVSWSAWKGKAGLKFTTLAQHARVLSDGPRLWKQAALAGAGSHPWLVKSVTLLGGRPAAASSSPLDVTALLQRMRRRAAAAAAHRADAADDDAAAEAAPLQALVAINRTAAASAAGVGTLPVLRAAEACVPTPDAAAALLRSDGKARNAGGSGVPPPVVNFSGRWRLDHARSDKVWDMMRRLGARAYLRPFADIGSLVNEISHDPARKVWHEKLEKFTWLTHRVTLWLDGREVEAQHPMDGGSKILSRSFVDNGAVVTETQYAKYGAAQRVERYLLLEDGQAGSDLDGDLEEGGGGGESEMALGLEAVASPTGHADVVYQVKNVVSFYDNPADPASSVTTRVYMRTFVRDS